MTPIWTRAVLHHLDREDSYLLTEFSGLDTESVRNARSRIKVNRFIIGFFTSLLPFFHLAGTAGMIYELMTIIKIHLILQNPEVTTMEQFKEAFKKFLARWAEIDESMPGSFDAGRIGERLEAKFSFVLSVRNISGFIPILGALAGVMYVNTVIDDSEKYIDLKKDSWVRRKTATQ